MTDARLELAPDRILAPPWARRLATLGAFVANGAGIGCWAAAIPRVKADLALSDATLSVALLAFAAGAIIAMPLMGLFAHRLRSGPASVIAGFGFAAALAAIGFAPSLGALSAATFVAGATHGAMDIAMNANASDIERRWGQPIMSSFHAGFSLGGAAGAVLGGWLGEFGTLWGLTGPALLASLLVAVSAPILAGEGSGFRGASFAAPSRRLLPLAALAFVSMSTEGAVGDWSGTYLARSGVAPSFAVAAYAAFSLLMITGRIVGDRIVAAAGTRATVGLGALIAGTGLAISAASPGLAGGRRRLRPGWRGPRQRCACRLQRRWADGVVVGGRDRFGRDLGLRGSADRAGRHRRCRFRFRSALGDRHAGGNCAHRGRVRFVKSRRPCARAVKAERSSLADRRRTEVA